MVQPVDGRHALVGELGALTVPDTLHSLLAARLDALDPVARSLAGDAAVIAAPFTAEMLADVSGLDLAQVHAGLERLSHRDVLQISADALSPQVGAYSFTHGLLAQVAYQTLSHRDLKERHLRVAEHLAVLHATRATPSPRSSRDTTSTPSRPGPTTTTWRRCGPPRSSGWCGARTGPGPPARRRPRRDCSR